MGVNDVWECVQLREIYNEQRCKRNKHTTPNSYKFLEPLRKKKNIIHSMEKGTQVMLTVTATVHEEKGNVVAVVWGTEFI